MNKAVLIVAFFLLIGGRLFLQSYLQWGMGAKGVQYLSLVAIGELAFVVLVSLGAAYSLRTSQWPKWLAIAPIVFVMLSSPLMFQFGESWANHGWSVSDVVDLMSAANIALLISLVAFSLSPNAK